MVALSFSTPWDQWDQVSLLDLLVSNPQALQRTLASVNLETAVEEASTVIEEFICNSTMDSRIDDFFAIDFDCNMEAATFNRNPDAEGHSCIDLEVGYVSHSLDYIVDVVEGLPPQKIHCSVLAADALRKAIEDYKMKKRKGANASPKGKRERRARASLKGKRERRARASLKGKRERAPAAAERQRERGAR